MKTDEIASKFLGKKVSGSENYDPSLLVAIPREENRKQYNLSNENLPFYGWDVWHAYEFSSMTENGIPVTRLLKLKYSCNSKFLVESKSLKLYLNSFNMTRFGKNILECLEICKSKIEIYCATRCLIVDNKIKQKPHQFGEAKNLLIRVSMLFITCFF